MAGRGGEGAYFVSIAPGERWWMLESASSGGGGGGVNEREGVFLRSDFFVENLMLFV